MIARAPRPILIEQNTGAGPEIWREYASQREPETEFKKNHIRI
jgi:hypothetical protein